MWSPTSGVTQRARKNYSEITVNERNPKDVAGVQLGVGCTVSVRWVGGSGRFVLIGS